VVWRIAVIAVLIAVGCNRPAPAPATRLAGRAAYADSGACPYECCHYGRWRADTAVVLHAAPDTTSRPVAVIAAGDSVDAPTGFVRTVPTPLVVKRSLRETSRGDHLYQRGETLWVYTYLGEGMYRARRDTGAFFEDMFLPSATEGVHETDAACQADSLCWAVFTPPTETVWWVQVRTRAGAMGWTAATDGFGKGECGGD
jgi:hypothetical protein